MPDLPWLSVVIPTYGARGVELTRACVASLQATHAHVLPEITVVSDGDDGPVLEALKSAATDLGFRLLIIPRSGFAVACNVGLRLSNGALGVFLVNNDIEFIEPSLQILTDAMGVMGAGVIGCRLLYPDRSIQHAGVVFVPTPDGPRPGYFDHHLRGQAEGHIDAVCLRPALVTGALFGISRNFIERVGYLDERYGFSAEDIDACLRGLEAGMPPYYCGYTAAIHHEGATRGRTLEEKQLLAPDVMEKEARSLDFFFQRWVGLDLSNFGETINYA